MFHKRSTQLERSAKKSLGGGVGLNMFNGTSSGVHQDKNM